MADCKESNEEAPAAAATVTTKERQQPTMQLDSPEESSDNSANDETEKLAADKDSDNSSSSNSMPNRASPSEQKQNNLAKPRGSVLAASRFSESFGVNSSDHSSSTNRPKPSLLRPSQLSSVTNSTGTKSVLQPAKFQNPFVKVAEKSEDSEKSSAADSNKDKEVPKESEKNANEKDDDKEEKKEEKEKEKEKEPPKFLALSATSETLGSENSINSSSVGASASTPGFVFGQNLKERVTVAHDANSSDSTDKDEPKAEHSNENGSSELMFSNAAAVCHKTTSKPGQTLTEAAHEIEEANRASKRKYSEVTLLTGEEDETNVLQINCKLFAFDKATSGWQERGRGSLRLNDKDEESRIVARAAGTQRLVLNTKVWPGMNVERAGPKSLRITAMDAQGEIRIFVVQAAQKEVEQLHSLLTPRLKRAQERQPKKLAVEKPEEKEDEDMKEDEPQQQEQEQEEEKH